MPGPFLAGVLQCEGEDGAALLDGILAAGFVVLEGGLDSFECCGGGKGVWMEGRCQFRAICICGGVESRGDRLMSEYS